jgi:hypothetical protein
VQRAWARAFWEENPGDSGSDVFDAGKLHIEAKE